MARTSRQPRRDDLARPTQPSHTSHSRQSWWGRRAALAGAVAVATTVVLGLVGALPAAATTGLTLASTADGLHLDLLGTELSGGNSSACVNDAGATNNADEANLNGDGTPSLCDGQGSTYAAAEGEGTVLTSSGIHVDQKAVATTPGESEGSANPTCAQQGGTPAGTPFTVSLGVSCAFAQASVDSGGNPSSSAMGSVADLTVGLNGLLSSVLGAAPSLPATPLTSGAPGTSATSSGAGSTCSSTGTVGTLIGSLCNALSNLASSAPAPAGSLVAGIGQVLENLYNVVTKDADPTVTIDIGQAKSSVGATSGSIDATSQGSSVDISILPGVGCAAPGAGATQPTLAQCVADAASSDPQYAAPLVEIVVSPAQTSSEFEGGNWVPAATGSVATLHINIPGDEQVIPVSPGTDQTILSGTPLQSSIALGSVQTSQSAAGVTSIAHGAVLNLLESSTFPGANENQGAISIDLDATGTSGSLAGAAAPAAASSSVVPPASAVGGFSSPTVVHTGEWWSGSLPIVCALGGLGAGLLGWSRIRRLSVFSRVVSRVHR